MKRPEEVKLSREEGEALIERLEADALSADDRRLLVKLIELYFWLTVALQETKISLRRLKVALFGEGRKQRKGQKPDAGPGASEAGSGSASTAAPGDEPATGSEAEASREEGQAEAPGGEDPAETPGGESPAEAPGGGQRRGHGRNSAADYSGAERVVCRHEELRVGQRCPVCGRGQLYRLPPGVEIRIDGNALLSAVYYELEKLRCSGCGEIFTAPVPPTAGEEKYSDRARAVLALSRYYLGVPFYRLESYQALLGVPMADATQWDQVERLADSAYPVFECLKRLAAQGEVIYQDDTGVRILSLIRANRQAQEAAEQGVSPAPERTGMYTTGLVVESDGHRICLYLSGRPHAGENLDAILRQRAASLEPPMVMSDALSSNHTEQPVLRVHCLVHGRRYFSDLDEDFPESCARVIADLKQVFEADKHTRLSGMTPPERLAYHQRYSEPIMVELKRWLEQQLADREVEPNGALGKAFHYLLNHWVELTRFLHVPGAPLDNNIVERALKLVIRQRHNSLFYASEHSAYVASVLTSLIATCVEAGVNALGYLVALQEHRREVFRDPARWLPWNYQDQLAPG